MKHAVTARAPRAARLTVFSLMCVGVLLFAEWSVRLALPAYDPAGQIAWKYHPGADAVLGRPNSTARQIKNSGDYDVSVSFNRYGFRDKNDIASGTPDDIYVVGDSFTFGWGIEADERFSNTLATLTGKRVFNLGASLNVDGYEKIIVYAERLGARIKTIVVALNMIDDIRDYPPAGPTDARRESVPLSGPFATDDDDGPLISLTSVKILLLRESALYFLITNTLNNIDWLRHGLIRLGLILTIDKISSGIPSDRAIATTADRLADLDRKYDLTVLLIPSRGLWLGAAKAENARLHARMRTALERRGLRVVDPRARLEKGDNPLRYHFRNDGHWNPHGHRIAAEALADAVSAMP